MTEDDIIERLKENVIQGRKNKDEEGIDEKLSGTPGVVELTRLALEKNTSPEEIINALTAGMRVVGEKFSTKESLASLKKQTPLRRLGQPEDVAGAVLFLASDSASYITGETISINGGLRMD